MGDRTARVELVGMDLEAERRVTNFHEKLSRGHWPSEEDHALIGVKLADELELGVGDKLVITVADARSGEMNHHLVRLSGLVFTNNVYLDRQAVLVALPTAQRLLGVPGAFHEIALALTVDARREAPIAAALAPLERPDLAVRPWQVVQKTLATVLELNDYVMWISVFVVFLIAAFGIVNTMTMSFLERYREFGILRAVGTSPLRLMGMVLTEAAWLGGLGVAIGLVLGLLAYWPLSVYGLTVGSAEGFGLSFDRTIYFDLDLMATVELSVVFFALTVLTALSTARRAAMVEPVRALRHV
jgi:ABC-type lipoprotein release transport system permease subunit